MAKRATELLSQIVEGDFTAVDRLLPLVYDELRVLADALLTKERRGHSLHATALVHEVYLKLVGRPAACCNERSHFFAVAAQAMRRILVDHARTRGRLKRRGGQRVSLDTSLLIAFDQDIDLLALHEALTRLAEVNPVGARVVELRYFGGLSVRETAAVMQTSATSVERQWRHGRAWLYRALEGEPPSKGEPKRGDRA